MPSHTTYVLTAGIDEDLTEMVAGLAGSLVALADTREARRWLQAHPGEPALVVARFRDGDIWSLNALLASLRHTGSSRVLLLADVPRPALPVLITDHPGLVAIDPEDRAELERALTAALRRHAAPTSASA